MATVFIEFFNRTVSASWLVLAIIILRFLFHKAPKWIHCLMWSLVGIRLLSPFSIESSWSLIPSAKTITPGIIYAQTPTIRTGIESLNTVVNPVISKTFAPAPVCSANPMQIWISITSFIWMIGIGSMLLVASFGYLKLIHKTAVSLKIKNHIYICDNIGTPFILGILKPRIYLPSLLSAKEQTHVLTHEYVHIKRKDHWWKPIGYILLSINWFNPLIWVAYLLLCRDIEAACDEQVIKHMTIETRKEYSKVLLNCSSTHRRVYTCPLAFCEVGVKSRIQKILSYKKPTFRLIIIAIALLIIAAICFLTDPPKETNTKLPSPYGQEYTVSACIDTAPQYSLVYTPETAPKYRIDNNGYLQILENPTSGNWLTPGQLKSHELSVDDFVSVKLHDTDDISIYNLVEDNNCAWILEIPESDSGLFYYLLQQKDGTLFLTLGHHGQVYDTIRWIFKLEAATTHTDEQPAISEIIAEKPHTDEEKLELAIHNAIIEKNISDYSNNYFVCESHIIFDTQNIEASGIDIAYEHTRVYLMALYQEYDLSDGKIVDVSGSHMPIILTFESIDDNYKLIEYWEPKDGDQYLSSIRDAFPKHCWHLATNTQLHILHQIQNCYDQAVTAENLDTDKILNDLYDAISQAPSALSSPQDYIDTHPIAFREITYYGMHTLSHAFGEFLKGGQTDLRGHLMALACQSIIETMGEPFEPEAYTTGQDWFDQFEAYACSLAPQIQSPYSSQFRPTIRLLLDMK